MKVVHRMVRNGFQRNVDMELVIDNGKARQLSPFEREDTSYFLVKLDKIEVWFRNDAHYSSIYEERDEMILNILNQYKQGLF